MQAQETSVKTFPSFMVKRKIKGIIALHDKHLSKRETGFALWAGYMLNYGIMQKQCHHNSRELLRDGYVADGLCQWFENRIQTASLLGHNVERKKT